MSTALNGFITGIQRQFIVFILLEQIFGLHLIGIHQNVLKNDQHEDSDIEFKSVRPRSYRLIPLGKSLIDHFSFSRAFVEPRRLSSLLIPSGSPLFSTLLLPFSPRETTAAEILTECFKRIAEHCRWMDMSLCGFQVNESALQLQTKESSNRTCQERLTSRCLEEDVSFSVIVVLSHPRHPSPPEQER